MSFLTSSVGSLVPVQNTKSLERMARGPDIVPVTVVARKISCFAEASSEPSGFSLETQEEPLRTETCVEPASQAQTFTQEAREHSEVLNLTGLDRVPIASDVEICSRGGNSIDKIPGSEGLASVRMLAQKRASIEVGRLLGNGAVSSASSRETFSSSSYDPSQLARKVRFIDGFVACPQIKPGAPIGAQGLQFICSCRC